MPEILSLRLPTNSRTFETGGPQGNVEGSLDQSVHWEGLDDGTPGSAERFLAALVGRYGLPDLRQGDHGRPANGVADELAVSSLSAAMLYAHSRGIPPPVGEWITVPGESSDGVDIEAIYDLAFTAPGLSAWLRDVQAFMGNDPAWTTPRGPHAPSPVRPGILQPKDVMWRFSPAAPPAGAVVDGQALTGSPLPLSEWPAYYKAAAAQLAAFQASGPLAAGERGLVDAGTYLRLFLGNSAQWPLVDAPVAPPLRAVSTADLLAEIATRIK